MKYIYALLFSVVLIYVVIELYDFYKIYGA